MLFTISVDTTFLRSRKRGRLDTTGPLFYRATGDIRSLDFIVPACSLVEIIYFSEDIKLTFFMAGLNVFMFLEGAGTYFY